MENNLESALLNIGGRHPHLTGLATKSIKGDQQAFNTLRLNVNDFTGLSGAQIAAFTAYKGNVNAY